MKLLLHTCCAPCSVNPLHFLKEKKFEVTVFFYNPNIHPFTEYKKRYETLITFSQKAEVEIIEHRYDIENFFRRIVFKENKNERCSLCWQMRLEETAKFACANNFAIFSTTLLISPYQNHELLRQMGEEIAKKEDVGFYYYDLRDSFRKSQLQAREQNLYCQKYCGCIFSEKEKLLKSRIATNF